MRNTTALLEAGNKAQLEKLERDSHKPPFEDVELWEAWDRLKEEVEELSIEMSKHLCGFDNLEEIRKESADISNFCHIIIYNIDRKSKEV